MSEPREHPIIFSTPMVEALLAGRKSQTRRVVKRPADWCDRCWYETSVPHNGEDATKGFGPPCYLRVGYCEERDLCGERVFPRWEVGDRLWVRETWADGVPDVLYRANGEMKGPPGWSMKWRPSIHMPRWASRLTLRVTDVRVERVTDIDWMDAMAEGVAYDREPPIQSFQRLWDSINAERGHGWSENPWVFAITFEVCQ